MKKLLFAVVLLASLALPVLAQDSGSKTSSTPIWDHGDNVSQLTYQNVTVYKVYDQKDAYIVLYAKQGVEIGQVTIPKSWGFEGQNTGRKLVLRDKPKGIGSYMTVIYKNDVFYKVLLNISLDKHDSVWSVAPYGTQVDASMDTLDIKY